MDTKHKLVCLSTQQWMYLKNADFLPDSLKQVLESPASVDHDARSINITCDLAEQLRSIFTERLAKIGFGTGYEPTDEGLILEELIDRFYPP